MVSYTYRPASDDSQRTALDGARVADAWATARVSEGTYYGPVWKDRDGRTFVVWNNTRRYVRYDVALGKYR